MNIEEGLKYFKKWLKYDDFSIGDSFWIGDWEFEVKDYRGKNPLKK